MCVACGYMLCACMCTCNIVPLFLCLLSSPFFSSPLHPFHHLHPLLSTVSLPLPHPLHPPHPPHSPPHPPPSLHTKANFVRLKRAVFCVGSGHAYDGGIEPWQTGAWGSQVRRGELGNTFTLLPCVYRVYSVLVVCMPCTVCRVLCAACCVPCAVCCVAGEIDLQP